MGGVFRHAASGHATEDVAKLAKLPSDMYNYLDHGRGMDTTPVRGHDQTPRSVLQPDNLTAVVSSNSQPHEQHRRETHHARFAHVSRQALRCVLHAKLWYTVGIVLFIAVFFYRCRVLLTSGARSLHAFVALFIIMLYIINSAWRLTAGVKDMALRWGVVAESMPHRSMDSSWQPPVQRPSSHHSATADSGAPVVELHNVSFGYISTDKGTRRSTPLSDVSLKVWRGERVLLQGQLGSGKSTLLKLLGRLLEPSHGQLFYKGVAYSRLSTEWLRQRVAYVPQQPLLFNRSVYDNLVYGMHPAPDATSVQHFLELTELAPLLPPLQSNTGKHGTALSGGQRQLVWLVRTLLLPDAEVALLDEPTASMDPRHKLQVMQTFLRLWKDRTCVLVTHDTQLRAMCSRVVRLGAYRV
jgi:ATP-binding cassette subfamily C protein LapB